MNLQRQVGLNVRRLRLSRKMPQEHLAFDAKMSLKYLSGIECGKCNPSLKKLGAIAAVFKVSAAELFVPVSERDIPKRLPRGKNVHHQGRKAKKRKRG